MRYYLHGDMAEHDSAMVYCAECEPFEPIGTFVTATSIVTQQRVTSSATKGCVQISRG
jgi:hypothetical protein